MNISAEWAGAGAGVVLILGGLAGAYLRLVDAKQAQEMKTTNDAVAVVVKRVDLVEAADVLGRRELEQRLAKVEREHITRADHAEFRSELLTAVRDVGERVGRSMDKLSNEIREDMRAIHKRVSEMENRG